MLRLLLKGIRLSAKEKLISELESINNVDKVKVDQEDDV